MRDKLRDLSAYPHHAGLAHDMWAPLDDRGQLDHDDPRVDAWFKHLTALTAPSDYAVAFHRWRACLSTDADGSFEACADTRLLIGHGNASPTEVGITLHHTWGVPVIPGSAVKGLLSHYLGDHERHDELFGHPPGPSSSRGALIVHDAWWIPDEQPFLIRDVLTVHHSAYYRAAGRPDGPYPDDHQDPIPVSFVTVRPGARFLVAVTAHCRELCTLALDALALALGDWGIGGKTCAGYGRLRRTADSRGMEIET